MIICGFSQQTKQIKKHGTRLLLQFRFILFVERQFSLFVEIHRLTFCRYRWSNAQLLCDVQCSLWPQHVKSHRSTKFCYFDCSRYWSFGADTFHAFYSSLSFEQNKKYMKRMTDFSLCPNMCFCVFGSWKVEFFL